MPFPIGPYSVLYHKFKTLQLPVELSVSDSRLESKVVGGVVSSGRDIVSLITSTLPDPWWMLSKYVLNE